MAALAQMLGIIAALPLWIMWRKRSAFVQLHAVQSMLLDVAMVVAIIALLGVLVAGILIGAQMTGDPNGSVILLALVALGMPLCSLAGVLVVIAIIFVLRIRAGLVALKGGEYRYFKWGVDSG